MERKSRVAILGGGTGALSAAFALTEVDPGGEKFEITIHQLGWRLGGKTASGRDRQYGERIEEHGLHVWAGFYENAFTVMRSVYKALDRPATNPLATIGDAFKRQNQVALWQESGPWPWWLQPDADPNVFPGSDSLFDESTILPSLVDQIRRTLAIARYNHIYYAKEWDVPADPVTITSVVPKPVLDSLGAAGVTQADDPGCHPLLIMAIRISEKLDDVLAEHREHARTALLSVVAAYRNLTRSFHAEKGKVIQVRRAFEVIDIVLSIVLGILQNDCLEQGLHVLDSYDFREFMELTERAWPGPETGFLVAHTTPIRALYDYIFAYENGATSKPRLSACSAVQGTFRLILTWKGAFFYKATAGFGDVICTPIYEVLKARGVKFKFFHKVTRIEPTPEGDGIGAILIDQQAALRSGLEEYHPLVPVKGIDCWPSTTLWDQIENGSELEAAGVDFESYYSPQPPPVRTIRLEVDRDFDQVILGISVGALGEICEPLVSTNAAWATMVSQLATTRTQGLQLWVNRDVHAMGGPYVAPVVGPSVFPSWEPQPQTLGPILTAFLEPFDTYADMSQLLPAEAWPEPAPRSVAYFCSALADDACPNDEDAAQEAVKRNAIDWMTTHLHELWTNIGQGENFRWRMLHSPNGGEGVGRLDEQFWIANISPSERYVLSLPGTLKYRMKPGASGYTNLFLAGDWTKVPEINAGCVEVAVMSGILAASALSGVEIPVTATNSLYGRIGAKESRE